MSVAIVNDPEFKEILSKDKKVVVKYSAGWCGSCRLFTPKFNRLSADERFNGITFLDIDAEKNPEARKLAKVDTLPYFATYLNGELLETNSTTREELVVNMLENIASKN